MISIRIGEALLWLSDCGGHKRGCRKQGDSG